LRLVRTSWQLRQPVAIAECTDLPVVLSLWQARQLAASALGSRVTGWVAARAEEIAVPNNKPARSSVTANRLALVRDVSRFLIARLPPSSNLVHACGRPRVSHLLKNSALCPKRLNPEELRFSAECEDRTPGFPEWGFSHIAIGEMTHVTHAWSHFTVLPLSSVVPGALPDVTAITILRFG